jgi:hypothetical protein
VRTDEELRSQGWDEKDITAYRRGWQEAEETVRTAQLPAARPEAPPPARYLPAEPFIYSGNSDRARWQRETLGGRLSMLLPQPDEAAELANAKQLADHLEVTYGNRPDMGQCLAKVRRETPHYAIEGTAEEIGGVFRQVGLPFAVVHEVQAPQSGGVVFGPGGAPQHHGDAGIAAAAHAFLARRRPPG